MNTKVVKSVTAIYHCMFGIIATEGDKIKFFNLRDFEGSVILFRNCNPNVLVSHLCLRNQLY